MTSRSKATRSKSAWLRRLVLGIWALAMMGAGALLLLTISGFFGAVSLPLPLSSGISMPVGLRPAVAGRTDLPAPMASTQPPATLLAAQASPTSTPAPAEPATDSNTAKGVFEPTFTPLVPVTPTPTAFITPVPTFEGPIVFGYSVEGRPMEAYRFGNGPIRRMLLAGIHGGYEWNTTLLMNELMNYLQSDASRIPRLISLYIIPTMNPDGLARAKGPYGRANANGVDLNRNFPVNWEPEWARRGCWRLLTLSGGALPGSEPETQAVMRFILDVRPSAIISYHAAALGIFPGGEPALPASASLAEALAAVSSYPYPPIDTGCIYSGTLPDFASDHGIAAVDLELHTHERTDFEENLRILQAFLEWRE